MYSFPVSSRLARSPSRRETQDKLSDVGRNSDPDVCPWICSPARDLYFTSLYE